jgi:hypothetical protein
VELTGFCTVKALNPLALLEVNQVRFGRITQFAWSQSSGLMNLTGHLVIIKNILTFIAIYITRP